MDAITQMTWQMVCEEEERASDPRLQADWRLVCECLSYKGSLRNTLGNTTICKAWTLADGFGPGLSIDYISRRLEWDWSHIRDSSNEAVRRMAAFLRTRLNADQYANV